MWFFSSMKTHEINLKCNYYFSHITNICLHPWRFWRVLVVIFWPHPALCSQPNIPQHQKKRQKQRSQQELLCRFFFSQQNWFRSDTLRGKDRPKYKMDKGENIYCRYGVKPCLYQTMQTPPVAAWALASAKLTLVYKRLSYATSAHLYRFIWCQSAIC